MEDHARDSGTFHLGGDLPVHRLGFGAMRITGDRQWDDVVDYCERENIGFIPWYPLNVGKVEDKRLALAWLLKRSPVMLPIPGTSNVKHLEENIAAASTRLTDEELASVDGR